MRPVIELTEESLYAESTPREGRRALRQAQYTMRKRRVRHGGALLRGLARATPMAENARHRAPRTLFRG